MVANCRIMPVITFDGSNLVKTSRFSNARYVGDPINAARIFNELEVDELVLNSIGRDRHSKDLNYSLISSIAAECFMPLTYGGGISSETQVERLLRLGVEKVIINSANFRLEGLIKECIKIFGAQAIIVGLDYKMNWLNKRLLFSDSGNKQERIAFLDYLTKIQEWGPGELFLNAIDRDGQLNGPDLETAKVVSISSECPVTMCGGVRGVEDVRSLIKCGVSGIAASSLFLFWGVHRSVLINFPEELRYDNRSAV